MAEYVTKDELKGVLREQTDEIVGVIQAFVLQMDDRLTKIEREVTELKDSHNRLLNTIDGFISRIGKNETELAARDSQFERLLA